MTETDPEFIANSVTVDAGMVRIALLDGSTHAFPVQYYPRLRNADAQALSQVTLRVGGRALRWEVLDEDIWITDAILQRYPRQPRPQVAETPGRYPETGGR